MKVNLIKDEDDFSYRLPFLHKTFFFNEDLERHLLAYKKENKIFSIGDKVVRQVNSIEYTIRDIEDSFYLIVRHPTPTRPHFSYVNKDEIVLKDMPLDQRAPLQKTTMKKLVKKVEKNSLRVISYYPVLGVQVFFKKSFEKTYYIYHPSIGILSEISPSETLYYRDNRYLYMYNDTFVEFIIIP